MSATGQHSELHLTQPLSFSHLLIQLLLECTNDELITNTAYISSLMTSSAAFDANKHISDETLKALAQNCFAQDQSVAQVSTTITNVINYNNRQLAKVFDRFTALILTPVTTPQHIPTTTAGLHLLQLFISHCDFPLLQSAANYLHQTLITFVRTQQQTRQTKANLPTSQYLRGLQLLCALYQRASTPGWTGLLQTLPSIRTLLDSIFLTAFRALQVPQHVIDQLDPDEFPELQSIMPAPISTLSPGTFAVVEYLLQLLLSLLSNNATLPMCKTHIPHIHAFVMLLVDLNIHSTTHLAVQPGLTTTLEQSQPSKLRAGNKNRLLALMGQVFALSCYSGKFNDVKQTLTLRLNKKNQNKDNSSMDSLLLPFPAEIFLHGLAPQTLHNQKARSDANPTGELKKSKTSFDIDTFLTNAKTDEEGNGILIDTTKTAAKAITGGKGDLSLQGGTVNRDVNERGFQGSQSLLQLKVAADDKIASEFLTDEFQTTQQGIYNKQQQMLHLDFKRCVMTMLITTLINHLIQVLPPIFSSYQTFLNLQASLQQTQAQAGFDTNHSLAYQLLDLKSIHRENLHYQQLITARTTALLTLLQSLLSVSPSSLQQTGQASSAFNNLAWLGFGGPGATFMQSTFRELSASHHQQTHNMKVRTILTDNATMNQKGPGVNNPSNDEIDQIVINTAPTLPTSLAMTFSTQNEQWHTQQTNQQQFQFESPLYRILQLIFTVLELEINSITMTKELALVHQFLPAVQIMVLDVFQTVTVTAGKQMLVYVHSFIPQLFQLYQSTTADNRATFLLGNHNLLILQQQILAVFKLLLRTFSVTIFTPNILSQLIPLVLFDFMSYFHDLTRVQQQFRLIGATAKENKQANSTAGTVPAAVPTADSTNMPLNRVVAAMANAKTFTFRPHGQEKMGFSSKNATGSTTSSSTDHIQQQHAILTTPSIQHLVPHSLQFPTTAQQQQHELYVVEIITLLAQLFSTTTSSLVIPADIFTAVTRILVAILHATLTPYGATLLPIPHSTLLSLLKLLHALAMYKPAAATLSPLLGEAMIYFNWVLYIPQYEIAEYAKQCLAQYASLLSPAMTPPSLSVETIMALNQLRDTAMASLVGSDSVERDGGSVSRTAVSGGADHSTQFSFGSKSSSANNGKSASSSSTSSTSPFATLDPKNTFPLFLYSFQQGYSTDNNNNNCIEASRSSVEGENDEGMTADPSQSPALDDLMMSLYHSRVRTFNLTLPRSSGHGPLSSTTGFDQLSNSSNDFLTNPKSSLMTTHNGMVDVEKDDNGEVDEDVIPITSMTMASAMHDDDDEEDDDEDGDRLAALATTATRDSIIPPPIKQHVFDIGADSDDNDDDLDLDIDFAG